MKKFDHPNVLPLLGVCMDCNDDDVFKIILPFITNGDLRNFLRCNRVQPTITDEFNNVLGNHGVAISDQKQSKLTMVTMV